MSQTDAKHDATADDAHAQDAGHSHNPHLAHHFTSMQQQYASQMMR